MKPALNSPCEQGPTLPEVFLQKCLSKMVSNDATSRGGAAADYEIMEKILDIYPGVIRSIVPTVYSTTCDFHVFRENAHDGIGRRFSLRSSIVKMCLICARQYVVF